MAIDSDRPVGRVGATWGSDGGVWAVWLARRGEEAAVELARLEPGAASGAPSELGRTASGRVAGYPQVVADGGRLLVAWLETGTAPRLRAVAIRP